MLLVSCQPKHRVNPAILGLIYRRTTAPGRVAKLFSFSCIFFIDAANGRARGSLLTMRIRIKTLKQTATHVALACLYILAALALDAWVFGPQF